ncbi:MAG: glycosyltransferase, partial [Chromatium okenii]|nr:glycosyltransferase [Chromatium okenii]
PWISDFRDPMAQEGYPSEPILRNAYAALECSTVEQSTLVTVTTPSAVNLYRHRYPQFADKVHLLENGYDEETFVGTEAGAPLNPGKITLLHSGIVYPRERNPTFLFTALATLKERNPELTN